MRSCQASAYGQWLQVNTTTAARAPSSCRGVGVPSVSGSVKPRAMARDRTLTRSELTAALAARQGLIERWHATPAEAIKRLTPLQAQAPRAPFVALAARLHDFGRAGLERALDERAVVKTTINRLTLHL